MKLFDIFKKQEVIELPSNIETGYITSISHWDKHDKEIHKLHQELIKIGKLKDGMAWLDCQIVPEPSNKYDKNALKVLAAGKKWHDIGYIYMEEQRKVKKVLDYTKTKQYVLKVGFKYNQYNGVSLALYLFENKKSGS